MGNARPTTLHAAHALVAGEIRSDVRLEVDTDGYIAAVASGVPITPDAERLDGVVVPGLANLHSHAFQRAMAGLAEQAGPAGDNFWTWRESMYRFLAILSPEDVEAIAAQLHSECLRHGYTAIGEFHYLHNAPDGSPYDDRAELSLRILAAAETSGIGLTLLPSLYRQGGFGGQPAGPGQRRFLLDLDDFAALCQRMASRTRIGVAPHSLRAVSPADLAACVAIAEDHGAPLHIHLAEQTREIADCLAWGGTTPVQWVLDHAPVGPSWCAIHATHMTEAETVALARSGAVAGLCPTTEANLGDGVFPLTRWIAAGGGFGVGGDSHVGTSPAQELRWLEYVQRLQLRARNVTQTRPGASVGAFLLQQAAQDGARALGRPAGEIAAGRLADLVVLDTEHPALLGRDGLRWLDAWVFSGDDTPVRHVMVEGRWVVRDGHHRRQDVIAAAYRATMTRLTRQ